MGRWGGLGMHGNAQTQLSEGFTRARTSKNRFTQSQGTLR